MPTKIVIWPCPPFLTLHALGPQVGCRLFIPELCFVITVRVHLDHIYVLDCAFLSLYCSMYALQDRCALHGTLALITGAGSQHVLGVRRPVESTRQLGRDLITPAGPVSGH